MVTFSGSHSFICCGHKQHTKSFTLVEVKRVTRFLNLEVHLHFCERFAELKKSTRLSESKSIFPLIFFPLQSLHLSLVQPHFFPPIFPPPPPLASVTIFSLWYFSNFCPGARPAPAGGPAGRGGRGPQHTEKRVYNFISRCIAQKKKLII